MLSIIVATANNNVIGKSNDLPWYLPADLKHFKEITTGCTVIMGRKTFGSIIDRIGKPLPNRRNIVISHMNIKQPGAEFVSSLEKALELVKKDKQVFVIGGATVYEQAIPVVDMIYMTQISAEIDGDTYFPALNPKEWVETERIDHKKDESNQYDYSFVTLKRRR